MPVENTIKVLIVDDMPPAREGLRLQLEMLDKIKIIGEAANVDEALGLILQHKPHLVFLDVNLPQKNGFDLLEELKLYPELALDVIFVTGFAEHALQSYDYYPFHFLLKPVASQKLKEVIQKYIQEKNVKSLAQRLDDFKNNYKISFKGEHGYIWLHYNEILWFMADRNYTIIYLKNGEKELVSENLGSVEKLLPDNSFFRSQRSYIINLEEVPKIDQRKGIVFMKNNTFKENPLVSKENIAELIKRLGIS